MKNYRFLVPIILLVLFGASIYMLYTSKAEDEEEYNKLLTDARSYRSQEIYIDAEENYIQALDMRPSLELYVEIGEMLSESSSRRNAIKWGESVLSAYPEDAGSYEFLMDLYIQAKDYISCFDLLETMEKRKVSSDKVGELISGVEYEFFFNGEYADVGIYSGNRCPVRIGENWGYANLSGKKTVSGKFIMAGYFSGDLAPVIDGDGSAYFVDKDGNKRKTVQGVENIKELGIITNDMFALYDGISWGFYNSDGEYVFGGYDEVSSIGNGIAAVKADGQWTLVNRSGKELTGSAYDMVAADEKQVVYRNERLFVYYDHSYHMIDSSGAAISVQSFEDVRIFNELTYAAVKTDGKWGFIDKDGTMQIVPQYEDARSFSNGFAAVKAGGKWGFIDMEGNMVIEPQFDGAKDFNTSGGVFVLQRGVWKLLRLYKYNH